MKLIGVDVDLTVCPSDIGWRDWLGDKYGYIRGWMTKYNFSEYYPQATDAMEYWRELDYSQFQPLPGSVEKLQLLSNYFGIVFISAIKGNHTKEKYYWLKEHFPFMEGYIATKEKFLMNNSVVAMIDDRIDNLAGFDFSKRVQYMTRYEQSSNESVNMVITDWQSFDVKEFCKEYLK